MTDKYGAQTKRGRLMDTLNNFAHKGSPNNSSSNSVHGVTSSTMTSSSSTGGGGFPSFRFSPDSEELEVIASSLKGADERQVESLPESPKLVTNTGGDTSPIKEYIRKNWASKWDKRSMSLDLDLKGKIITAIEDKKKSVLSHFIPEESSGIVIPTSSSSSSIPEHTGVTVAIGEDHGSPSDNPTNSNSEFVSSSRTSLLTEVDSKQQRSGHNHGNNKISFDNTSKQVNLSSDAGAGDSLSVSSAEENYEEVGLDYLENMTTAGQIDASVLDHLFPFTLTPEQLQESPLGVPKKHEDETTEAAAQVPSAVESQDDLQINSVVKDMLLTLIVNKLTLWVLIPLLAVGYYGAVPAMLSSFYWFAIGLISYRIIDTSWFFEPNTSPQDYYSARKSHELVKMGIGTSYTDAFALTGALNQKYPRSQGWMTELEGDYDPHTYHVRQTKAVFVRMEGPFLYISYPHSKNRISKRRLWSDAPISTEVTFSKHVAYHLLGSHIFIAPDKLTRRRVWNKKYPIGIQLGQLSIVATITQADSNLSSTEDPTKRSDGPADGQPESNKYRKGDKDVIREDCGGKILYLFARTDREKDDWYRRLIGAAKEERPIQFNNKGKSELSNYVLQKLYLECMKKLISASTDAKVEKHREAVTLEKTETKAEKQPSPPVARKAEKQPSPPVARKGDKDTSKHQAPDKKGGKEAKQQAAKEEATSSSASSKASTPTPTDQADVEIFTIPQSPVFLNAFIGRIFFDFLRSTHWTNQVQKLIQKKLNYIRRPPFLDSLLVRDIDLGHSAPVIQSASAPFMDSQGLWIDLDLTYEGNLCITLETKLNLMKLRKSSPTGESDPAAGQIDDEFHDTTGEPRSSMNSDRPNFLDSDADDSGESSDDDDLDPDDFLAQQDITANDLQQSSSDVAVGKTSKGAKILRMAEKLANSNFVTDVKVVKKVLANVANTPLILSVELKSVKGTLALNIPPPPTNRLWIGFRENPDMQVVVKPKVGSHAVNVTHITEFIRKKLLHEFQRVMVLPNMDDVSIPLMDFKLPTY